LKAAKKQVEALAQELRLTEEDLSQAEWERDCAEEDLGNADYTISEMTREAEELEARVVKANREVEELKDTALAFLEAPGAMTTPALERALLDVMPQRTQLLQGELAARQAGPPLHVPDGTACAFDGAMCPNPLEVALGCSCGHWMCRPCFWHFCEHARQPGGSRLCPQCRELCPLPPQ
jgi:hypothetical protein